ncbi:Carboxymuconolactone decarboxylase [Mycena indigotica]|uniref:Carboxymuconolactone decarboxylase n=1 Tax=Mycena indigotica TaxID=2126181 RepID=A0A8H6T5U2_9AGAR|nr:Carboxymuconolactone decarboxylase [Mycena indigotica]KAF7312635.1 Carboxymuconolactone decarboxylase [Mycena indigotica]
MPCVLVPPNFLPLTDFSRAYSNIKDIPVGAIFPNRAALAKSGLHAPLRAGHLGRHHLRRALRRRERRIRGRPGYGVYTGQGKGQSMLAKAMQGNAPQQGDQDWKNPGNLSLKRSAEQGKPLRVIRGDKCKSKYAPTSGFRYDGLYKVSNPRRIRGKEGHMVCVVDLVRLLTQPPIPAGPEPVPILDPTEGGSKILKADNPVLRGDDNKRKLSFLDKDSVSTAKRPKIEAEPSVPTFEGRNK